MLQLRVIFADGQNRIQMATFIAWSTGNLRSYLGSLLSFGAQGAESGHAPRRWECLAFREEIRHVSVSLNITDFWLSRWLIIDNNSVIGLLHREVLEVHTASISRINAEDGGMMYLRTQATSLTTTQCNNPIKTKLHQKRSLHSTISKSHYFNLHIQCAIGYLERFITNCRTSPLSAMIKRV